jgi:hypothetical protein
MDRRHPGDVSPIMDINTAEPIVQPEKPQRVLPEGAFVPSHGAGYLKPFQPGQSGNSKGNHRSYTEVLSLAREASPEAMRKMIKLMNHRNAKIALVAAEKVLDRAWGRPKEIDPNAADPASVEQRNTMRAEVIRMLQALAVPEPLTPGNAIVVDEAGNPLAPRQEGQSP